LNQIQPEAANDADAKTWSHRFRLHGQRWGMRAYTIDGLPARIQIFRPECKRGKTYQLPINPMQVEAASLSEMISNLLLSGLPLAEIIDRMVDRVDHPYYDTDDPEVPRAHGMFDYVLRRLAQDFLKEEAILRLRLRGPICGGCGQPHVGVLTSSRRTMRGAHYCQGCEQWTVVADDYTVSTLPVRRTVPETP
jgi:hypothetical protein